MSKSNQKKHLIRPRLMPADQSPSPTPTLRFSLAAWAKLSMFCHAGETEIGGFGITSLEDPLRVEEFFTVRQHVSAVTVSFADDAVAEFFENQVDAGRKPEQFARIWLHTHPCDSAMPSFTDESTFKRVFGSCSWAVMFILSRTGKTYARLRFNVGPVGEIRLPVAVDLSTPYPASEHELWKKEYEDHVFPEILMPSMRDKRLISRAGERVEIFDDFDRGTNPLPTTNTHNLFAEFRKLDLPERQRFLEQLADQPELWVEEGGELYEWI